MKKSLLVGAVAASMVGVQASTASASTTYRVKPGDTLYDIGLQHNLSVSQLKALNRLNSDTIHPGDVLVLGEEDANKPAPATPATTAATYTVKSGDTLSRIAAQFKMSVAEIAALNQISNVNAINVGQVLKVNGTTANTNTNTNQTNTSKPAASNAASYTVQSGDTLSKIAASHQMSLSQLAALNGITNPNLIRVGQVLKVTGATNHAQPSAPAAPTQQPAAPAAPTTNNATTYTVKAGDTLSRIAAQFKMNLAQIAALNQISNLNAIRVGQVLKVSNAAGSNNTQNTTQPSAGAPTNTAPSTTGYTVKSGDTLSAIAAANGVSLANLLSWNNLSLQAIIYPGQKLTIQKANNATVTTPNAPSTNTTPTGTPSTNGSYTVKSGDTLYGIAAKLGTNVQTLLSLNGLQLSSTIYVGQVLKTTGAPVAGAGTATSTPTPVTPTVSKPAAPNGVSTAGLSAAQAAWLRTAVVDAQAATAGTGVLASVTVAQAILESGWGQSALASAPYHNLFGIKKGFGWTGAVVNMNTSEFENGKWVTVVAPFRAYGSQMASFQDHTNFLLANSRYAANGVTNAPNYIAMATGLQAAGYATAPTYASALINLVERYNLQSLD
ncbi:LysM peptidoglycan-binding domain-containing protein [Leuconostoc lactis]|uniref:LysM peptidoglycan-binding domain-containing protein n=1 Tax=Leuconostoc lactis TaxID=1246 RepID=UPI0006DC958A|nr:LysM peptidoglycan-binding domain-containing protein [Leuconostoc lactis]KQB81179.1 peptidoglycan hydrolase [Leuconostoc lactis]QEA47893.1 LysM peptidoglycan-binding domain-containing protein [Leuconostoc lactis]HBP98499.1 LysM peptidoglycan-binding domain-containing protein [Leuconostoc lactis]